MAPRFRYCLDPVFLAAAGLYALNRFALRPMEGTHGGFFHDYGNSLLCIPFCLPPCLWAFRRLGLRDHDRPPTRFELAAYLIVWSVWFKGVAPHLAWPLGGNAADPWDVVAYAVGAGVAGWFWGVFRRSRDGIA